MQESELNVRRMAYGCLSLIAAIPTILQTQVLHFYHPEQFQDFDYLRDVFKKQLEELKNAVQK